MLNDRQPRSFLNAQVLSRLAGLPLFARRPMQGNVSGRHASPHRGASIEWDDLVCCRRNTFRYFLDLLQYRVRGGDPLERRGVGVVTLNE